MNNAFYNNVRYKMYLGYVKDVHDPEKLGRIKVEIPGRTAGIPVEDLPWYYPTFEKDQFDLPKVDECVKVWLQDNCIYLAFWECLERTNKLKGLITDDDYVSAKIWVLRDLADNEHEGIIRFHYTKTDGVLLKLRNSAINIREDHTVAFNKDETTWIDINERRISVGTKYSDISEDKEWDKTDTGGGGAQQPVALGTDTAHAINMVVEEIHEYEEKMDAGLNELAQVASSNPYTSPLAAPIKKLAANLKQVEKKWYSDIRSFLPEILSNVVVVDKK